jgi:hypothetical protein
MQRPFILALTLLLSVTMGVACAGDDSDAAGAQQPAEEEHPQGDEEHPQGEAAEADEHPEGEAAEGEEHPEGEAAEGEEHPEGEAAEGEEHPEGEAAEGEEHPEGEAAEGKEHPEGGGKEHPEESPDVAVERLTIDELAEAITEWVAAEAAETGGFLVIEHPDTGESLELTLDKVHRERLSRVGEQTYFACADFVGRDGTLYDLDVFMQGPDRESLKTTEVTLHKVNGEARYTWYEEDGVWKKRPVG